MKRALITGVTGQDGSYLAELLLNKGYEVYGLARRTSTNSAIRETLAMAGVKLIDGDVSYFECVLKAFLDHTNFDECYHLAAQSHVGASFKSCVFTTLQTNVQGTAYVLEALRTCQPGCRLYFAGSSEMFGKVRKTPQTEKTPFYPRSPYGVSKVAGYELARNYREAYGLHISCGILFNHESPRRGPEFVTRKITQAVARIKLGRQRELRLGNRAALRDWGYAPDYVKAMWMMLQADKPDDYVVATGEATSVATFCAMAFREVGLDHRDYVKHDEQFNRPTEVDTLLGDSSKIERTLGWRPTVSLEQLVRVMVRADLRLEAASAHE